MTHKERLAKIEEHHIINDKLGENIGIAIAVKDYKYLLTRVRVLTEALESITVVELENNWSLASKSTLIEVVTNDTKIARKALEEK